MSETAEAIPAADEVLAVLAEVADAIAAALDATSDWGETGGRAGEHHSDLAADAAALAVLDRHGFGVLSEESGHRSGASPITVVVDPLDGSTNAARHMSWWATSLCAVDGEGPLAALVVDLRHGTRWSATRGGGASRDGEPIAGSGCDRMERAIVGLNGVPHRHGGWAQYRAFGACALDLCAVADGTLDGYLDCTTDELGPWDYLGGLLVCREAGVLVADAVGRDLVVLDHAARRIPVAAATAGLCEILVAEHHLHP
jgi:fructose-1,6-bisphosphatase/inositol monophosphatase family enzyme